MMISLPGLGSITRAGAPEGVDTPTLCHVYPSESCCSLTSKNSAFVLKNRTLVNNMKIPILEAK